MSNKDILIKEIAECFNRIYNVGYLLKMDNIINILKIFENKIMKRIEESN